MSVLVVLAFTFLLLALDLRKKTNYVNFLLALGALGLAFLKQHGRNLIREKCFEYNRNILWIGWNPLTNSIFYSAFFFLLLSLL